MPALQNLKTSSESKKHVKSLLVYIKSKSKEDLERFAKSCGTTSSNLLQIAYGGSVSAMLSKKINKESEGKISLSELRPDIFS
ncbi:helix-turn-helix domain-containing protein [Acinetobacter baumannii]|uniref:YdaS family helix-turn-helix protein n=1 Tax=Acinetobacter baumannii TaxID=470 RepID=UPI0005B47DAC|nr:YdaS family helix-turn-helix protein [Acinetobacter baumannii]EHU2364951.1 helix-turn-helix domain-containing protein [Acinetobacter baumannii]MDC5356691.1 helix-turn-helix domain-containing protein [Acinetobacter baumannii]HEI7966855.1 helix-turn-helix domain-containing protein [Acinetobacter baumannii]